MESFILNQFSALINLNIIAWQSIDLGLIISVVAIVLLLISSALVSGSEIAFFSLNPKHIKEIKSNESSKDLRIIKLLNYPEKLLAGILISNNLINVTIILLSTYITEKIDFGDSNKILIFIIQIIGITTLLLLFGEIIPKVYANKNPMRVVNLMEKTMSLIQKIFGPVINILANSTNLINKKMEKRNLDDISMSELGDAVEITKNHEKEITKEDHKILKGITTFGDKEVKDIMTARIDIISLDSEYSFTEILEIVNTSGYSRIPVYEEKLDNLKGILYIKDLLPYINNQNYNWLENIREPYFVPENKKISDLFQEFKLKQIHIAIVVDEYGGTIGLITLEDVLEEIVGEISDEFDSEENEIKFLNPNKNEYIFEAKTSINDFCKIIEEDEHYFEEVRGDADSLGGLFLEMNKSFPKIFDKVKYKKFEFIVISTTKRKINKIKILRNE